MDKEEIFARFGFFTAAPSALKNALLAAAEPASLPAGTVYYREQASCQRVAFVGQGSVRVFKSAESGREITLYHVGPGESCILTASCVLTGQKYPATAVVEPGEALEALVVPSALFQQWVAEYDVMRNYVFELMSVRLTRIMTLVEEVAFGKMDRRLAGFLIKQFDNNGVPLKSIAITHEKIADELGTAREVVSRLLKDFEQKQAVEIARGRIRLESRDSLIKLKDEP